MKQNNKNSINIVKTYRSSQALDDELEDFCAKTGLSEGEVVRNGIFLFMSRTITKKGINNGTGNLALCE